MKPQIYSESMLGDGECGVFPLKHKTTAWFFCVDS